MLTDDPILANAWQNASLPLETSRNKKFKSTYNHLVLFMDTVEAQCLFKAITVATDLQVANAIFHEVSNYPIKGYLLESEII